MDVMTFYENYAGDVGYERENLFSSLSEEYDFVVVLLATRYKQHTSPMSLLLLCVGQKSSREDL